MSQSSENRSRNKINTRFKWTRKSRELSKMSPNDPRNYMKFHFGFYEPSIAIDAGNWLIFDDDRRGQTTSISAISID